MKQTNLEINQASSTNHHPKLDEFYTSLNAMIKSGFIDFESLPANFKKGCEDTRKIIHTACVTIRR